jgi:hypothetical protein
MIRILNAQKRGFAGSNPVHNYNPFSEGYYMINVYFLTPLDMTPFPYFSWRVLRVS